MRKFHKIISIFLLGVFLFQACMNAAIAEGGEMYSLEDLPFGDIDSDIVSYPVGVTFEGSAEERLEMLDNPYAKILEEDIQLLPNIQFTYTGTEEIRTLLAEKRNFESVLGSNANLPLSLHPYPSILQFSTPSPLDFFLSGTFLTREAFINTGSLEWLEEPLPTFIGERYRIEKRVKKMKKLQSVGSPLRFEMESGTEIRTANGEIIDMGTIDFSELDTPKLLLAKTQYEKKMKNRGVKAKGQSEASPQGFEFGRKGVHLLFSKPVKITMEVENMTDGNAIDLLILHEGDADFHTGGLSVNPSTLCNNDGTASIPGATAIVKNGKVTFYTCSASSFTMNPSGGISGSNDLRLVIGDCGQFQLYYNGASNIYTGNPPATGCNATLDNWIALRIGGTTYWSESNNWTTRTTVGTTIGNTYTGTTTLTRAVGGRTYTLILDWNYTAPNKYFTINWSMNIPTGNTNNVRFYLGNDSMVAGADTDDLGYTGSTPTNTVGVYDNVANQLSAIRYISGPAWTAQEVGLFNNIRTRIRGGTDFNNTIQTTPGDLGFGVNWNFGTTPGTYTGAIEWKLTPFSTGSTVDLIPGIGLPEGPLMSNLLSELPINISNAGNLDSSGSHTVVLSIPVNINGPTTAFTNNGWSCGAQVGTGVTCTKITSVTGSLVGEETVRIPVTPTLAASGTNVTFYATISGGGDSNLTNNVAFATSPVTGGAPANDPGGIASENLWLMGNNGTNCTVTGCTITTWTNRGALGPGANAVTGLGTVIYDPVNDINGNPTLSFNNASLNTNNTLGITGRPASVFVVSRIGAGGTFLMGPQTAVTNGLEWATSPTLDRWQRYNSTIFYNGANNRTANEPSITSTLRQATGNSAGYTNGQSLLSSAANQNFTATNIGIGRITTTNSTLANIAEIIVYNTALTTAQKNQVESYLAIKYGITLDQSTPTNYLGSNGTILWNATSAGVFQNNIAGIARDDLSTLSQLRSQSVTDAADIIVSKSSIGTNRRALLWGNNHGNTTSFTGNDAPIGFQKIAREWLFQEKNGDIGVVTLSYPETSVPSLFTGTLMMLIDGDGSFATGATAYTGTYNTGTASWDFSVNIGDMQYMTFAKTVPVDVSPPSITAINIASGTLIPKGTFSLIVNYTDTGSEIDPASFSGHIYPWDATGSTWSTTNIAGSYMLYSSIPNTASGGFDITNLPYGKYRFDITIADTEGNSLTRSFTYFVDAIEWSLSSPIASIGDIPNGPTTFSSGEVLITVRTIGAGFNLTLLRDTDLSYSGETITVYDGTHGWGYDKDIGSGYANTLTAHGTTQTLITTPKNINQNGLKNTFIYRVKFGINPSANSLAGEYIGNVSFGINLNY